VELVGQILCGAVASRASVQRNLAKTMIERPDEHPLRVAIDGIRASALRAALVDGENSGPSTEFDFDDFLGRMRVKEIAEIAPAPRCREDPSAGVVNDLYE